MQGSKRISDIREALLYKAEQCETESVKDVIEYKSRVGAGFITLVSLLIAGMTGAGIYLISLGAVTLGSLMIGVMILCVGAAFILGYPIQYIFTEQRLVIRCGAFYRKSIPLGTIKGAYPVFGVDAAPAWGFKRLRITFSVYMNLASVDISPEDMNAFLYDLTHKCPQLTQVEGKALTNRAWE
ncbi:MAG: PH domain-containing protein [Verrucomicrobiota bacterium]